ncbi:unnamed protein product [Heligmosomoides polygyrus]|uniref:SMP-LTD domain-containing protein n=1 Tax=Heligmosomoides polygyrus TaxID=6339 RepID=A0A183GFP4_HELPZ|nr:unnamed protein product [Heligmosomoides polygyrus]
MSDERRTSLSLGPEGDCSDTDSQRAIGDRSSVGSNDSKDASATSKLGAFIDKAKSKGKKLVASRRDHAKASIATDFAAQCVIVPSFTQVPTEENREGSEDPYMVYSLARRCRDLPFFKYRMMLLGILMSTTFVFPGFITGLLWGLYISFIGFLCLFVSDPRPKIERHPSLASLDDVDGSNGKLEQAFEANNGDGTALGVNDGVIYRGWMNELKGKYSPATYHVNNAQSVLVRLEGTTLRISRPAKAVLKHAFHEDPTLTQPQPTMVSQTIYSLEDAHVSLRPKRLAQRRWWSRKYPIYIRFSRKPGNADLSKPLSRSVSMHPVETAPDSLPFLENDSGSLENETRSSFDEGYTAETDSSDESEQEMGRLGRASSFNDVPDFLSVSEGTQYQGKRKSVYLFVRAAREKERWFHLLREACAQSQNCRRSLVKRRNSEARLTPDNKTSPIKSPPNPVFEDAVYKRIHKQFAKQMSMMLGFGVAQPDRGSTVSIDLGTVKWRPGIPEENSDLVESINSLGTRIFFDFCRDEFWANQVKQKIQSKLATIHLPYFIEKLELSSLSLGSTAPRIVGVYTPKLNEWGIWVDLEMKYGGGIRLVLQTSVNLLKLQYGATKQEVIHYPTVARWYQCFKAEDISLSKADLVPDASLL